MMLSDEAKICNKRQHGLLVQCTMLFFCVWFGEATDISNENLAQYLQQNSLKFADGEVTTTSLVIRTHYH
jgi:hypothetical protein